MKELQVDYNFLAGIALILGGYLCIVNFYLLIRWFVRCHRQKLPEERYRYISETPILGSLFVALSLIQFHSIPALKIVAILLILIDVNGIHWLVLGFLYMLYRKKTKKR